MTIEAERPSEQSLSLEEDISKRFPRIHKNVIQLAKEIETKLSEQKMEVTLEDKWCLIITFIWVNGVPNAPKNIINKFDMDWRDFQRSYDRVCDDPNLYRVYFLFDDGFKKPTLAGGVRKVFSDGRANPRKRP